MLFLRKKMKKKNYYFTTFELLLWGVSSVAIVVSFFLGSDGNVLALLASLIGTASLILAAKGNLVGPLLMVVFSVLYGIISYGYAYYGEMITYLGMSAPIALATVFVWLKNPSAKGKAEVKINSLSRREYIFMWLIAFAVTVGFYFILKALDTTNLLLSTLSVLTSFLAAWLSMRRSKYFALAYAANDVVLIILWIMASFDSSGYFSVVVCFAVFLINDLYGFFNWRRMQRRQSAKVVQK